MEVLLIKEKLDNQFNYLQILIRKNMPLNVMFVERETEMFVFGFFIFFFENFLRVIRLSIELVFFKNNFFNFIFADKVRTTIF